MHRGHIFILHTTVWGFSIIMKRIALWQKSLMCLFCVVVPLSNVIVNS